MNGGIDKLNELCYSVTDTGIDNRIGGLMLGESSVGEGG